MPADRCSFGPHLRPYDRRTLQPVGMSELDAYACIACRKAMDEEFKAEREEERAKRAAEGQDPPPAFGPINTTKD